VTNTIEKLSDSILVLEKMSGDWDHLTKWCLVQKNINEKFERPSFYQNWIDNWRITYTLSCYLTSISIKRSVRYMLGFIICINKSYQRGYFLHKRGNLILFVSSSLFLTHLCKMVLLFLIIILFWNNSIKKIIFSNLTLEKNY